MIIQTFFFIFCELTLIVERDDGVVLVVVSSTVSSLFVAATQIY